MIEQTVGWAVAAETVWFWSLTIMAFTFFLIPWHKPNWESRDNGKSNRELGRLEARTLLAQCRRENAASPRPEPEADGSRWACACAGSMDGGRSREGSPVHSSKPSSSSVASSASTSLFARSASAPNPCSTSLRRSSTGARRLSSCSCDRCCHVEQQLSPLGDRDFFFGTHLASEFLGERNSWGGIWVLRVWPACFAERASLARGLEVPASAGEVEDIGSLTLTTANGFVDTGEMLVCLGGILKQAAAKHRKCVLLPGGGGEVHNGVPVSTVSWSTLETSRDETPWSGTLTVFPCVDVAPAVRDASMKPGDPRVMGLVHAQPCSKGAGTEVWAFEGRRVVAM